MCCVAVWCSPTPPGQRSPSSSTSARCRGWRCHIQTRLDDHDSTDSMEYKVFYSHLLLLIKFKSSSWQWRLYSCCFFSTERSYVTHKQWHNGCQLSGLGWQTATHTALQPEECGLVIKFTVSFTAEVLRLSLCASLFSPESVLRVCAEGCWDEVSKSWLSAPSCKRMWGMHSGQVNTAPFLQFTTAPTSVNFSPHAQTGIHWLMHSVCWQMVSVFDKADVKRKKVGRSGFMER